MMLSNTRLALIVVAALLAISQQPVLAQVAPQGEPGCTTDDDCDDGLFCTGAESCVDGGCVALSACPPGINGCVMVGAICDEENDTCLDEPDDSLCDNGLFCDGAEFCDPNSGECLPGLTCPAAIDGCKVFGACDEDQDECISELDDELCDEGEFCNEGGRCQNVGAQCVVDDDCDDGLFCTGAESCLDGSCVAVSACPPGVNGCVMVGAICDEENDTCLDEPDDSLCDNGLFCDGAEFCDPKSGECLPGLTCPAAIDGCKVFGACDEDQDECISELDDELCDEGEFCDAGGQCQVVAFRAFLPVAPASVEPDIPFTRVHVVNVGDESTPVAFSIIDGTGELLDRASTDIAPNGSATYAASVPGQQTQSLNSPIIPASVLVTSDLPLAVIAEVTLRVGDETFPPFGAVPVDACAGWSYVHSESAEQRSGIALHNSDPDSAASCDLSFFEGVEGVPIGRIQRDIPAGHRIQFFPGDEVPASSKGGGLPEGMSAAFIRCDVPVYAAVLNQAPGGAIILNEATCLARIMQEI